MRERGSKKYNTLELTEGRRNRKTNEAMDESFCHSRNGNDIIVVGMECVNGGWQKGERKKREKKSEQYRGLRRNGWAGAVMAVCTLKSKT